MEYNIVVKEVQLILELNAQRFTEVVHETIVGLEPKAYDINYIFQKVDGTMQFIAIVTHYCNEGELYDLIKGE